MAQVGLSGQVPNSIDNYTPCRCPTSIIRHPRSWRTSSKHPEPQAHHPTPSRPFKYTRTVTLSTSFLTLPAPLYSHNQILIRIRASERMNTCIHNAGRVENIRMPESPRMQEADGRHFMFLGVHASFQFRLCTRARMQYKHSPSASASLHCTLCTVAAIQTGCPIKALYRKKIKVEDDAAVRVTGREYGGRGN